uniref:Uncharacterized protein n=1 Tax=Romanomermis culicivorax TaxID=13658 RepID=A0A915INW3_ROMCU
MSWLVEGNNKGAESAVCKVRESIQAQISELVCATNVCIYKMPWRMRSNWGCRILGKTTVISWLM